MKKISNYLLALCLCFISHVLFAQMDSLTTKVMNVKEMQEDFTYLRKVLEETHAGLYRYTPKAQMQAKMDSIAGLLNQNMPFYDYYRLIAFLIAEIHCAHTNAMPVRGLENWYVNTAKTFPYSIQWVDNKFFVVLNGTLDKQVKLGDELMSINGKSMQEIKNHILRYLWGDGYNQTAKNLFLTEVYFPLMYYMLFDTPEIFDLRLKNEKGEIFQVKSPAQTWKQTNKNFAKNPVNSSLLKIYKPKNKKDRKKGWRLEFLDEPKTAYLRIKGFDGGKDETEARQKMRDFLNKCMAKLHSKKTENLIIDLRYNGGGWDIQGVELLAFLMQKPFRAYQSLHSVTDSSEFLKFSDLSAEDLKNVKKELKAEPDGTFSVREEYSEQLKLQQPHNNAFKGKIYILINGRSGSTTSEFTAVAHSNKVGIFIGEETGGAYEGGNGGSFLHFDLPNSKIHVSTPLLYYRNAVSEPKLKGRGTMPDYDVPNTIYNMLQGIDKQLNFTLELIRRNQ
jgi:Peptidase family S41